MSESNIPYTIEKYETTVNVKEFVKDCVDVAYFQGLCKSCPNYRNLWSCPDYDFDANEYWQKYEFFRIIATKIILPQEIWEKEWTEEEIQDLREKTLWKVKKQMTEEFFELERQVPGSVHLSAGFCLICGPKNCERKNGRPCRHPDKLRYSIESLGGNVTKTAELLGQELEWTAPDKMPHHFLLVGGLLYNG